MVSTCRCDSPAVDTPQMRCFEEVDYEKALGQLLVARREVTMSHILAATVLAQGRRTLHSISLLLNCSYSRRKCDSQYQKTVAERNVSVGGHSMKIYNISGTVQANLYPVHSPCWSEYESCCMLMCLLNWCSRIVLIWTSVVNDGKALSGAWQSSRLSSYKCFETLAWVATISFWSHVTRIVYQNVQSVLGRFSPRVLWLVDEIGLFLDFGEVII